MCRVEDAEPWTVWSHATPVARKEHVCCECGRTIRCGERYHRGRGLGDNTYIVHLHVPAYRPSAMRARRLADRQGMCGVAIWPNGNPPLEHALVDLAEALEWTAMDPSDADPRPTWSWCRHCVGHLVALSGSEQNTLARLYGALTKSEVAA